MAVRSSAPEKVARYGSDTSGAHCDPSASIARGHWVCRRPPPVRSMYRPKSTQAAVHLPCYLTPLTPRVSAQAMRDSRLTSAFCRSSGGSGIRHIPNRVTQWPPLAAGCRASCAYALEVRDNSWSLRWYAACPHSGTQWSGPSCLPWAERHRRLPARWRARTGHRTGVRKVIAGGFEIRQLVQQPAWEETMGPYRTFLTQRFTASAPTGLVVLHRL